MASTLKIHTWFNLRNPCVFLSQVSTKVVMTMDDGSTNHVISNLDVLHFCVILMLNVLVPLPPPPPPLPPPGCPPPARQSLCRPLCRTAGRCLLWSFASQTGKHCYRLPFWTRPRPSSPQPAGNREQEWYGSGIRTIANDHCIDIKAYIRH